MSETFKLEICGPGKEPRIHDIVPGVYSIGSDEDNRIMLPSPGISPSHALLVIREDSLSVEDLGSESGTFVDGVVVKGMQPLIPGQSVTIGQFALILRDGSAAPAAPTPVLEEMPAVEPAPAPTPALKPEHEPAPEPATISVPETSPGDVTAFKKIKQSVKQQIHKELVERLDLKRLAATHIGEDALHKRAHDTLEGIVKDVCDKLPEGIDPMALVKEVYDEAIGLGPLEDLIDQDDITEIMVNGHEHVYVERRGKLELTDLTFLNDASVTAIIERIVSPIGRRIDESQPYVDARLKDGSRVNAIIAPLSLIGPCLTIRKFSKIPFTDQDLVRFGTLAPQIAEFAKIAVLGRKNIIVAGGTGSGKTTFLNVLSSYLPDSDRILTIEDAAELRLRQTHVVRLEARPPNIEGKGAITIRDLVRNSLRMRPDRIVIGECRGGEALDMLQAMNTGHDGSLTTIHANSPRDVVSRLETMVLMSGMDLPVRAIREQVASAVDLIIHESRYGDGTRKISKVTEVVGLEGDRVTMQDIFEYVQTGIGEGGTVLGTFRPTGAVPTWMEELKAKGLTLESDMFNPQAWDQS